MLADTLTRIYTRAQVHLAHIIPPVLVGLICGFVVLYITTHSCRFEEVC